MKNRFAVALVLTFQSSGEYRSELFAPESNRFVAYGYAALGEHVLDIPVTEIEPVVEPNGVADDIGRESVAFVGVHPQIMDQR